MTTADKAVHTVDFSLPPGFSPRPYKEWKKRADRARVAFAPFGGGPYFGYEVGVIDAMHERGIVPDVFLPGCVGNFVGMYHLQAAAENRDPRFYIEQFAQAGLMHEADYLKAPIPPLFPMRLTAWMKGFLEYYASPAAWTNPWAPHLLPNVVASATRYLSKPTDRNLGMLVRDLSVWHPLTRLMLGGYYFAPIGAFGELYDPKDPEGWINPAVNWASVYGSNAPLYLMSLLRIGSAEVTIATNCLDHPAFAPVDGRRLASASNLPWLIAETEIDGHWYRESAVRDVATLSPMALDSLPNLETLICVQIMDPTQGRTLTSRHGNHDNYSTQVTEMIGTIGGDDIRDAQGYLESKGRDVEFVVIQPLPDDGSKPHWTFENFERCRRAGYEQAKTAFAASRTLNPVLEEVA